MENLEDCMGEFSMACHFRSVAEGFEWSFAGTYNPNMDSSRSLLWDELSDLISWRDVPWCVGWDFNVIRFPSEKWTDSSFTILLILDKFLVSPSWDSHFP